jgi:dolichyl-diphosphooligosaccharide--protein glycosyltransferase/undecaprenyl-diphosphooligosaccharide--protein glycosyltransferase
VATIGYILLALAYPVMFIMAPLLGLGYAASFVGIRFTMFATPVLAFGMAYMFYGIKDILIQKFSNRSYLKQIHYYAASVIVIFMIHNILLFNRYSAFNGAPLHANEVKLLKTFSQKLSPEDKIVTWWDYGWPLWYYTGYRNTLADNGAHGGPDTHIIAKILMSQDQNFTANTAKYFSAMLPEAQKHHFAFILPYIAKSQDIGTLLQKLNNPKFSIQTKGKTYILLHKNMLEHFKTIHQFATLDLKKEKSHKLSQFISSPLRKLFSQNYSLIEAMTFNFDSIKGVFIYGNGEKTTKINEVILTKRNKEVYAYIFDKNSPYYIVVANRIHAYYMNKSELDSFLVKAFLLNTYSHTRFKKVAETRNMKIFNVKK